MKTSASEPGLTILYYDKSLWYPDFGLFEKFTLTNLYQLFIMLQAQRDATTRNTSDTTGSENGSNIEVPTNNVGS